MNRQSKVKRRKQILSILMTICMVVGMLQTGMITAWAEWVSEGEYYIKVVVHDTDTSVFNNIDSCNNSAGYLVVPTRKQDGTPGQTWSASVKKGEWDTSDGSWEYTREEAVNGFPTQLRTVQTNSLTAEDWIKNNNKTYTSIINFKIYVSPDNKKWTEVLSYDETTKNGGYWSDTKKVDSYRYPKHDDSTLIGSGRINHNGRKQDVPIGYIDQYGVAWGFKYDKVVFYYIDYTDEIDESIFENMEGIDVSSITDGELDSLRMDSPQSYTIAVIGSLFGKKLNQIIWTI